LTGEGGSCSHPQARARWKIVDGVSSARGIAHLLLLPSPPLLVAVVHASLTTLSHFGSQIPPLRVARVGGPVKSSSTNCSALYIKVVVFRFGAQLTSELFQQ
jgi:hypothetical protein